MIILNALDDNNKYSWYKCIDLIFNIFIDDGTKFNQYYAFFNNKREYSENKESIGLTGGAKVSGQNISSFFIRPIVF